MTQETASTETTVTTTEVTTEKKTFDPLPNGEYLVRLKNIEEKESKAGNNMLKACFQVIQRVGGEKEEKGIANRLIFENFLLDHKNPKVVEITADKLGKYAKAVHINEELNGDYTRLFDTTDMPFIAKLGLSAGTNGYPDSNKIVSFIKR